MFKKNISSTLGIPKSTLFNQSIIDVFVLQGILELEDAEELKKHFKTNREIENFLIKNRLVTRETINKAYSIILKLPFIELKNVKITEEVLDIVPEKIARKFGIIPFDLIDKKLKIAVTNPADLTLGFSAALSRLFRNKKIIIELFITVPEDLREALKQYSSRQRRSFLMKKGSLPVVYLRNREIPRVYLNKIPKDFIEKYRLLVFDENISGDYLIACEKPDSPLTKKILDYIKKDNKVSLEIFATSEDDINYVLENYDHNTTFLVEPLKNPKESGQLIADEKESEAQKEEKDEDDSPTIFSSLSDLLFKPDRPSLTVDSIVPAVRKVDGFNKVIKKNIIIAEDKVEENKLIKISLIGKIDLEYLKKLPREFIEKYRVVVFGENNAGELMIATDQNNHELTEKAIEFIKNQHPVELFSASAEDIEYAINVYK